MPRETYRRKTCANCGNGLPDQANGRPRKFCSDACRKQHDAARSGKRKSITGGEEGLPPAKVQDIINEIIDTEGEDIVRQVMSDEIRAKTSEYVADKVLGSAELLVEMLPLALAQVFKDLQSESWIERKTAYSMLMKYGFMFRDKGDENKGPDLSQINVAIGIPVPDSPMGDAFTDAVYNQDLADADVEAFETSWPQCAHCHKRTHPDNVLTSEKTGQHTCLSCNAYLTYKAQRG